jgi:hypothetical protein
LPFSFYIFLIHSSYRIARLDYLNWFLVSLPRHSLSVATRPPVQIALLTLMFAKHYGVKEIACTRFFG